MFQISSFAKTAGLGALLLMNLPSLAVGQPVTITGRVLDGVTLQPIVAATVEIRGDSTSMAVTDSTGRYSIEIPRPDVILIFSAPGFAPQEIPPAGRSLVNVTFPARPIVSGSVGSPNTVAPGTRPCDGAALPGSPALDPRTPPRRMPESDQPSASMPNACAVPTPGSAAPR